MPVFQAVAVRGCGGAPGTVAKTVNRFEAADKYERVLTDGHEYLLRTPLRSCSPGSTPARDEAGKLHLRLRGRPERLAVSRLYAHLFKAM